MTDTPQGSALFGLDSSVMREAAWGDLMGGLLTRRLHDAFSSMLEAHPDDLYGAACELASRESGMEIALVTRFVRYDGAEPTHAMVIANHGLIESEGWGEYALEGTPCNDVTRYCFGCVPCNVSTMYPGDLALREMGIESYAGAVLTRMDGFPIGGLMTLSRRKQERPTDVLRAIVVVGQRLAIEIERRRKEAELSASARQYRDLVESMPDGLVVYKDREIVFANPRAARLRGLSDPSELIGRTCCSCSEIDQHGIQCLSGVHEIGMTEPKHVVDCTVSDVLFDGEPAQQVIERDLSTQRHLERRMLRLFDSFPNARALLCPEGRVQRVNHAMRELFQLPVDIEHGQFSDYLPYSDAEHLRGLMRRASEVDHVVWIEYTHGAGGGVARSMRWVAVADPEDGSISLIARDVSREHESRRRLREAESSRTITTMTSGLAHDLGNLFSAISAHLYVAREHADNEASVRDAIDDIDEVLAHAMELKDSLRTLGGEQFPIGRTIDLCALVRDAQPLLQRLIADRATLRVDAPSPTPLCVFGDASRLKQVLVNLVVNARNAMRTDHLGTIAIGLDAPVGDAEEIVLTVEDDGPGVDTEIAEAIFEPFFTTNGRSSGTGLGLALCKAIVKAHGGSIGVGASVLGGARFEVRLPLAEGSESDDRDFEGLRGVPVFLAYPDGQERRIITGMLERMGMDVRDQIEGARAVLRAGGYDCRTSSGLPEVVVVNDGAAMERDDVVTLRRPFGRDDLARAIAGALRKGSPA